MAQPPGNGPKKVDRSQIREAAKKPKKSSSIFVIILIAVFGGGGLVIFACAGWFIFNLPQPGAGGPGNQAQNLERASSGEAAFKAASGEIAVKAGSAAKGNSEAAIKLAAEFSKDIKVLRENFFTQRKKKPLFSLSDGEFLTYCRLDDRVCVFLVHVPDLRKFSTDAKADLADLAWATAQQVVNANLETPPPKLAVGLRGVMFYDRAIVGKVQTDESAGTGIEANQSGTSPEKILYSFFKTDAAPAGAGAADAPAAQEMQEEETPDETTPAESTESDVK